MTRFLLGTVIGLFLGLLLLSLLLDEGQEAKAGPADRPSH